MMHYFFSFLFIVMKEDNDEVTTKTRILSLELLQESHIHSLINGLRYSNLADSLQGEPGLVCDSTLEQLSKTEELDYMSYIVLRLFEKQRWLWKIPKDFA
ncbi:hypothetical protein ACS0TY_009279 [Phlomoides rotata]